VIGDLKQPDARGVSLGNPVEHGGHKRAADLVILRRRIDADRPDSRDDRTLVEEVATHDAAVTFCDDAEEARMADLIPD
jgi:hypothetical protein